MMDLAAKRKAIEGDLAQAQQQVAAWTEKLVGFRYQLALLDELAAAESQASAADPTPASRKRSA